jgi:hypothetical protein
MSTTDDAFTAKAKSLNYTFRAKAGTKPTWIPRWGFVTDEPGFDPRFDIGGQFGGWYYGVSAYGGHGQDVGEPEAKRGPAVNRYSDFAGVLGTGVYVTGVAGTSVNNVGVYGQTGEDPESSFPRTMSAGVVGASNDLLGVIGWSTRRHGVAGSAFDGRGVTGRSFNSVGVHGMCDSGVDSGVLGISGMNPPGPGPKPLAGLATAGVTGISTFVGPTTFPGFSTTPGVFGTSSQHAGVVGTSNALMGVYGFSTNNAGVVGQSANPNSFGGYFFGNVVVTGNLTVNGTISSPNKQAVVAFPDGTQRVLYCMESPEYWFEDFGAAKLKRGRAAVKIDANFARVIKRGDYRVFVTPEGDCRGLYVRRKTAASFEVRELAGGKSNVAFSYRIVGRRNDIKAPRFAKTDTNTRLPLPAAPTRRPRKRRPARLELRAFIARVEKEMREGSPKPKKSPPLPRGLTRPQMRPPLPFPDTEQT